MRLQARRPRSLLVIAPHADDETIGAHALMTRLRARGVPVRVLVVTDGHASHPGSHLWPRARLVRERQRETRRVLRPIGVTARDIRFLGLPDGGLPAIAPAVARAVQVALCRALKPVLVAAPALADHHPDHRVVAAAVAAARMAGVRRLHFPVWPAGTRLAGARTLALTAQERLAKRRALRGYRTQAGLITDDPAGFAISRNQLAAFTGPVETFLESR